MPAEAGTEPVWGVPTPLGPWVIPPPHAEVVVIGGGITGVALLAALLARGVDAVLLERDRVGAGASGRNAGFLLAGVADNYATAVRTYGRTIAREVWAFTVENHALVAASPAAAAAGYARRGSSVIALNNEEAADLGESAQLLAEDGFAVQVGAAPPGASTLLVNPGDGEVDPLALVRGMAIPLAARVHEGAPVVVVEDGQSSATLRLGDGSAVVARTVIVATNAWIAELLPAVPVRPVRAQMLAAAGPESVIPRPAYAERGHRYWRQRGDGTVLVGGFRNRAVVEEVGYDLTPTARVQCHIEQQLRELGVSGAVTHRWCGTMGFSPDGLPLAGRAPAGRSVWLCGGYTGHGMGFAVHAARRLVDAIVDGNALPAWLDAARLGAAA